MVKHSFQRNAARLLSALLVALAAPTTAQTRDGNVIGGNVKKYADGALAMMCFSVVPDLTSSSCRSAAAAAVAVAAKETPAWP